MTASTLQVALKLRRRSATQSFLLDASFEVPPGITVVLGASGSGKSTLLSAIAGLVLPDEGRITVGGEVWLDTEKGIAVPCHKRALAMAFQSSALFPHMTALGNVEFALDRSLPRGQRRDRALALLEQMKVGHLAGRYPSHISGGEAQRVSLARALARSPRLVLLDEPFSALDTKLRLTLAAEVCEHLATLGVPALFVTHHQEEAVLHGSNALLVAEGSVRFCPTVSDALAPAAGLPSSPLFMPEQTGLLASTG